jgi:hypothetical protein
MGYLETAREQRTAAVFVAQDEALNWRRRMPTAASHDRTQSGYQAFDFRRGYAPAQCWSSQYG